MHEKQTKSHEKVHLSIPSTAAAWNECISDNFKRLKPLQEDENWNPRQRTTVVLSLSVVSTTRTQPTKTFHWQNNAEKSTYLSAAVNTTRQERREKATRLRRSMADEDPRVLRRFSVGLLTFCYRSWQEFGVESYKYTTTGHEKLKNTMEKWV